MMNKCPLLLILLCSSILHARELDLQSAFELALANSQKVKIQEESTLQYSKRVDAVSSTLLPKVQLITSLLKQDEPDSARNFEDPQKSLKLNMSYSLYKGGKDSITIELAQNDFTYTKLGTEESRRSLFLDVVTKYYRLKGAIVDLQNLKEAFLISQKRIQEIKRRTDAGKTRRSELLASQVQEAEIEVQVEVATREVDLAKDELSRLLGTNEPFTLQQEQADIDVSLDKETFSIDKRADVRQLDLSIASAKLQTTLNKRGHFPTLDLSSNYHFMRSESMKGSNYDALITLTVPLYEGGVTSAKIQDSLYQERITILKKEDLKKSIEKEIEALQIEINHLLTQIQILSKAESLAKLSYEAQLSDYRFAIVTILDLITAQKTHLDVKRNIDKAKNQLSLAKAKLRLAVDDTLYNGVH